MAHDKVLTEKQKKEVFDNVQTTINIVSIYPKDMTIGEVLAILKQHQEEWKKEK